MEQNTQITPEQINELYQKIVQQIKDNKIDDALNNAKFLVQLLPQNADLLNCLGRIYHFKGKIPESIDVLTKAVKYDSKNLLAYYNLGLSYVLNKDLENAKKTYAKYIELSPENNNSKYIVNLYLSKLHFDLLDIEETQFYYRESRHPLFEQLSKLVIPRIYNSNEEMDKYRQIFDNTLDHLIENYKKYQIKEYNEFIQYTGLTYCSGFPLSYQGKSNKEIYEKQCKMFRLIYPSLNYTSKYLNNYKKKTSSDKIHIGFISTNFFNQSVTRDRMGVIRNLPREIFDVTVFYYFKPNDDLGLHIWNSDNNNIILPESNLIERRELIEKQKLDILVYCDIGMAPDTFWLSFSRLAPVQINTWGHSDTSGIDTLDYFMSSSFYEEEWSQENYSEKLVRLDSLCTYYYKIINNPEMVTKDFFGIDKSKKLYLCCQTLFKINPSYDIVIKQILEKDKNALFAFVEMSIGQYIQEKLINRLKPVLGDMIDRVIFMPWQNEEHDFYKVLSCADVLLDSVPFGGCNTSFSSFGMGLPIVTFPGRLINGRFTLGMYRKMGIDDLIVYNNEDYVNKAYQVANDPEYRKMLSDKILDKSRLIFNEDASVDTWSESIQQMYRDLPREQNNKISNSIISSNLDIPYIFHFIFFGYTEFLYIHYLAIKTCYDNNSDATIYLYNTTQPQNNIWWNNILEYVTLVQTNPPEQIFNNKLNTYAHRADIIRLEKLIKYGGIYLDIDVLTLQSFKPLLNNMKKDCVMGFQAKNTQYEGLCNATIIAKPNSEFLLKWYDNYKTFNGEEWDVHSVHLPKKLADENPNMVEKYDQETFFPVSWWFSEKYKLFSKDKDVKLELDNTYSMHMWETKWNNILMKINPEYIIKNDNKFCELFRGNISKKKNILYIGSKGNSGYAIAGKGYIKTLLALEYNIKFTSFRDEYITDNEEDDLLLNRLEKNNIDYDTIICHTLPSFWNLFKEEGKKFIGIFVWETTELPMEWVDNIKNVDKIITPSKFNCELIAKYNTNVYYVPHLIEDINVKPLKVNNYNRNELYNVVSDIYIEYGEPFKYTSDLINSDTFIYYTIGTFEVRKNIELLINIYNKLDIENTILYIKSNLWTPKDIQKLVYKFKFCRHPIVFNFDNVNLVDIYNIHKKGNCFISTSFSEGVGLSIIQAAYYKNSVIYNKFGGTIEYIPFGESISYTLINANDKENELFNSNEQKWGKIVNKELITKMLEVYNLSKDSENMNENITKNYNHIKKSYNLNVIANHYKNILKDDIKPDEYKKKEVVEVIEDIIPVKENVEILVIGDLDTLRKRMDKNIYKFFTYLKNYSKYHIIFITKKTEGFYDGIHINEMIAKHCITKNPIIYSLVYDRVEKSMVSGLNEYNGNKIYDLEDVYDIPNLIECIKVNKYNYIIYKYECEQQSEIIRCCPEIQFYRMPHYIDLRSFNKKESERTIDLLLYGNNSNFYPFRQRLFRLVKNSDINYYEIPFPGYGDERNPCLSEPIVERHLANIINLSKFTICTCSSFNYLLKKYFESALCGSVIIGNIPEQDKDIFGDNYINVNDSMSDSHIINIIKDSIEYYKSEKIQNMRINMYNNVKKNYTYQEGMKKFDKFINYTFNKSVIKS
jgi:protein O-GlcNAc transferase